MRRRWIVVWGALAGFLFIMQGACVYGGDSMQLKSSAFLHNEFIPARFTCQGEDINPPLEITGVPAEAKSLVLIIDDPDAPRKTWDHWVVYSIPADTTVIAEDSVPGIQGTNSWGRQDYGGPCPPSGVHRYFFKLYAVDTEMALSPGAHKTEVERALQGHILMDAGCIGLYEK